MTMHWYMLSSTITLLAPRSFIAIIVTLITPVLGQEMVANEAVRKIGFTGSTAVGKILMAGAANTVKV